MVSSTEIRERPIRKSVTLTLTEDCNLNCIYCYEHNKTNRAMSFDTAKKIIDYELSVDDNLEEVEIDFFGGEPFLEFDTLKSCCEYIWSKSWPKKLICFATTNGTLVHGEIKLWLENNKKRFWCGLSFDGTRYMHNINRCDSFDSIDWQFFKSCWPLQPVKMTVSPKSLPFMAEGIKYIYSLGLDLSVNLAYGIDWSDNQVVLEYENQLEILINYYIDNKLDNLCNLLSMAIDLIPYGNLRDSNKWCGTGEFMRSYDIKGNVYPCQFFLPLSVGVEKADKSKNINFSDDNVITDPNCIGCVLLAVCPTCYGSNYLETGNVATRNKDMCLLNKKTALAVAHYHYERIKQKKQAGEKLNENDYNYLKGIVSINQNIIE